MNDYPEHNKKSKRLPYDPLALLLEKEEMRKEFEHSQRDLPKPIRFDDWYCRVWN